MGAGSNGDAQAFTLTTELGRTPTWGTPGQNQAAHAVGTPALKLVPQLGPQQPARAPASTPLGASQAGSVKAPDQAPTPGLLAWPELLARIGQSADGRAAQADAQASTAVSRQQWASAWMPRLDASANSSTQNQRYNGNSSQTPSSSVALTATLPLWRPAERAAADAQAVTAQQASWQARNRQVALAQELSLAWLDAADAAEQLRLTQAHTQLLDAQLQANERRLLAGLGTVLDPLETRTRLAQVQAQADQLASRLRSQSLTIERLSGPGAALPRGLNARASAAAAPNATALPPLTEALTTATDRNPALQDARAGAQAADDVTRARSAESWQPTVDATASASRVRQTQRFEGVSEQQNVQSRAVGVALNWPLLTGGYQLERQREATALLTAAQARVDSAQQRLDTGLRDAYQRLDQAQARLARLQALVDSAQATQDALTKAWAAGLRSNTELLNSQQQLFEAKLSLSSARVAAMQATVDALALLDWLDADHIAPLMGQFDLGT
jgi:outer membrane protein